MSGLAPGSLPLAPCPPGRLKGPGRTWKHAERGLAGSQARARVSSPSLPPATPTGRPGLATVPSQAPGWFSSHNPPPLLGLLPVVKRLALPGATGCTPELALPCPGVPACSRHTGRPSRPHLSAASPGPVPSPSALRSGWGWEGFPRRPCGVRQTETCEEAEASSEDSPWTAGVTTAPRGLVTDGSAVESLQTEGQSLPTQTAAPCSRLPSGRHCLSVCLSPG